MKNYYSLHEFKSLCNNLNICELKLYSYSVSDIMGSVCKLNLNFSSIIISEELNIITFKNNDNSVSLMMVNNIYKNDDLNGFDYSFKILCGLDDNIIAYDIYININNCIKEYDKTCIRCKKYFNMYDIYNGLNINKIMGYGSKYDGENKNINICVKCLDDMMS